MATYSPESLGIKPPKEGFQQGGWYNGRQYWGGTLSDPGVIHPSSNQQGAGQAVSKEVNAQSAAAQGVSAPQLESYLDQQRKVVPKTNVLGQQLPGGGGGSLPGGGSSLPGGGGGTGAGISAQPTLNLPELYKTLYDSSGISLLEGDLSAKEKEYIEAKGKINDNPFLSEATRVGRVAKIESLYNERTQSLRNDIATKKADIETKLNLETKQFDINSQSAQQALSQFNTLLAMGALDSANGDDIANITRSTGLSSNVIQSAISSKKQKDVQTQVITSTNDAGVVTATVINPQTGEIINQQSLGSIGNAQTGGAAKEPKPEEAVGQIIRNYLSDKGRQAQISPEDLYRELLLQYPAAQAYVSENWQPQQIRDVIGN